MTNKHKKKVLLISISMIGILVMLLIFIEILFSFVQQDPFYSSKNKIWGHRGLNTSYNDISISNINNAIKQGMQGIELDVWHDKSSNSFILNHESPSLDQTSIDFTLQSFLNQLYYPSSKFHIWLDLKNLNENNQANVLSQIRSLKSKHTSKVDFIVESKNGNSLRVLSKEIATCYWIPHAELDHSFTVLNYYRNLRSKLLIIFSNYNAISMSYSGYLISNDKYDHLNIHTWLDDRNKSKYLRDALEDNSIKVLLLDQY